jgi:hypothetical protein
MRRFVLLAVAATTLGACSTVMEANRPAAVNINKYGLGEKRLDVMSKLGAPVSTVRDGANSCDVYQLYTKGTSKAGKVGIIFTEAAADVFTLGLAEVVATPTEAATKSHTHTVLICYDADEKLVSMRDEGKTVQENPIPVSTAPENGPQPVLPAPSVPHP